MKILSSFTHPYAVPNLHDLLSSSEHNYWRNADIVNNFNNHFWFPLTSMVFFVHTVEVNGNRNCLVTNIFKIASFVFQKSYRFGTA